MSRKATRSIRISLDLDEEVEQHQKEFDLENYTQSLLSLVKLGIQSAKFRLEIKENPEKEEEIRIEYENMLDVLTDEKQMSQEFSKLPLSELIALKQMISIEEDTRKRKNIQEEKGDLAKRQGVSEHTRMNVNRYPYDEFI
jgi:hypothetical protein